MKFYAVKKKDVLREYIGLGMQPKNKLMASLALNINHLNKLPMPQIT